MSDEISINAIFEIGGGFLMWLNVKVLYGTKEIQKKLDSLSMCCIIVLH